MVRSKAMALRTAMVFDSSTVCHITQTPRLDSTSIAINLEFMDQKQGFAIQVHEQ